MNAKELMIGDLLYLNRRPVRVDAIGFNGSISYSEKGGFGGIGVDKLSPIPITKDILVKNGFEDVTEEGDRIRLLGTFDENDNLTFVNLYPATIGYGTDTPQLKVYYVHQLQHLLRLCGIEKEVKL